MLIGGDAVLRLILAVGEFDAKAREQLRRALFWQGFGGLGADCFVHSPADLTAAFDALPGEGLSPLRPPAGNAPER